MEELISYLAKMLSDYSLGDASILLDQSKIIKWDILEDIKSLIMNDSSLKRSDIIHLYYSRVLQALFAEKSPTPEAFIKSIALFADLKNCIKDYNFENSIEALALKISKSIKNSSNLEAISMLVKEIKNVKTIFGVNNFTEVENNIYSGLKEWIVKINQEFDIWLLRECYINIDSILTKEPLKQKISDLVAVKVYSWFQKTCMINYTNYQNFLNTLDINTRRIFNWITSIDCRSDINAKIENLEPLIGNTDTYAIDSSTIYRVTQKNQLANAGTGDDYISSIKKKLYHLAVYKKKIQETGDLVVVKSFISNSEANLQNGFREKEIYEKLSKNNMDFTLKYYGFLFSKKNTNSKTQCKLSLILEHCHCTLADEFKTLAKENRTYRNHEMAQNVYNLLDLYKKLRIARVNHCDIKPQNIFITSERRFKIGDFDLSETFNTSEASELGTKFHLWQGGGTENYLAPELKEEYVKWKATGIGEKRQFSKERSDVYSLGLVFLFMIKLQWIGGLNELANQNELTNRIDNLELDWEKRLLRNMLAYNYKDRPRFKLAIEMLEDDPEFILCLNSSS